MGEESLSEKAVNFLIPLLCIAVLVAILESAMGLITIGRLERQVNLLKELNAIARSGTGSQDQLSKLDSVFESTVDGLANYRPYDVLDVISEPIQGNQAAISRIFPGSLGWLLLALVSPLVLKQGRWAKFVVFMALFMFAIVVGIVIAFVVNMADPSATTFVRFMTGLFSVVAVIVYSSRRSEKKRDEEQVPESADNS